MKYRLRVSVLGGACVMSFGSEALAQSLERLSLGAEIGVFSIQSETLRLEGFTGEVGQSTTAFGLGAPGFGLNLAGGVSENVVLGAEALIANASAEVEDSTADATQLILQSRVEYVFGSESFRPFVAGLLGYRSDSTTSGDSEFKSSLASYGVAIGAHGFVNDSFSIDPMLSFQGLSGSRTSSAVGMTVTPDSSGTLIASPSRFPAGSGRVQARTAMAAAPQARRRRRPRRKLPWASQLQQRSSSQRRSSASCGRPWTYPTPINWLCSRDPAWRRPSR